MKKILSLLLVIALLFAVSPSPVFAVNTATHGGITSKTFIAGLTSLLIWPGIGQHLNDNEDKKVVTHAILGLTGIFRLWSGWDALVGRQGGRWDGKI
ncbi:MAG: hypothetical protein HY351_00920 [Candidatus Omnitrophica bacterium]|nr:hypothetical protein [Candidatus Omnitrophota bacterium]